MNSIDKRLAKKKIKILIDDINSICIHSKELNAILNEETLDFSTINDDLFINEESTLFINYIYKIVLECLKLEIIKYKTNNIYNYILNNPHDFWYVNVLLKEEIEELLNSINYVSGIKGLKDIKGKNLKNDNYLNKEILNALMRVNYKTRYLSISLEELDKIDTKFDYISYEIREEVKYTCTGLMSPPVSKLFKKIFDNNFNLYLKFINEQGFMFDNDYKDRIINLKNKIECIKESLEYYTPSKGRKRIR